MQQRTRRYGLTEKARRRLSARFVAAHERARRPLRRQAATAIRLLADDVMRRLEARSRVPRSVDSIYRPAGFRRRFVRTILPGLNRSFWSGAAFEQAWIEAALALSKRKDDAKQAAVPSGPPPDIRVDPTPEMRAAAKDYLAKRGEGIWNKISSTLHDRLGTAIESGLANGESLDEMTAKIQRTLKGYTREAAERIARTQTTGAMNTAGQAVRQSIGIEKKEWVATLDSRTRTGEFDHLSADGQIVGNADAFVVSGELLMHPGDGSQASAGNVVNCRCVGVSAF